MNNEDEELKQFELRFCSNLSPDMWYQEILHKLCVCLDKNSVFNHYWGCYQNLYTDGFYIAVVYNLNYKVKTKIHVNMGVKDFFFKVYKNKILTRNLDDLIDTAVLQFKLVIDEYYVENIL